MQESYYNDEINSNDEGSNNITYKYSSGIPTLRSSSHRVRHSTKKIQTNEPKPKATHHNQSDLLTNGSPTHIESANTSTILLMPLDDDQNDFGPLLPSSIRHVTQIPYNIHEYNFNKAISDFLRSLDSSIVGSFHNTNNTGNEEKIRLENFVVPIESLWKKSKRGILLAQDYLSQAMHDCFFPKNSNKKNNLSSTSIRTETNLVQTFDDFVTNYIIPHLKQRLIDEQIILHGTKLKFYYQRPPTLRIQPGPSKSKVNCHKDKDYGHQNGELNFWIPLTDRNETGVDLYVESEEDRGDFQPLGTDVGYASSFFGSGCSHFVNENISDKTRISLDFRVGIEPFYDPNWSKIGTRDDHFRRCVEL